MSPTGRGWVDIPVAIAATLAAHQFLWRKGIRPVLNGLKKLGKTADEIIHAAKTVPLIEERVTAIEWQLRPNGGTSLRDIASRIEGGQQEISRKLDSQDGRD